MIAAYDYANDALGRRTPRLDAGAQLLGNALGDCHAIALVYYGAVKVGGSYDCEKNAQPAACVDCCREEGGR